MPTLTFTNGSDSYTVSAAGDYDLDFLDGADTLIVDGGTSTLASMGAGDDFARFLSGPATVYGNRGADRFEVRSHDITADAGPDDDLFQLVSGSGHTLYGQGGSDRFFFYGNLYGVLLLGGNGNDIFDGNGQLIQGEIHGNDGNDLFIDFTGATIASPVRDHSLQVEVQPGVILYGGAGNDTYRADPINPATFIENPGEGFDTVEVARGIDYTLPDNIEHLTVKNLAGSTGDNSVLDGNGLDNTITGSDNVETLRGYAGNDRLSGMGGNDTLQGGSGNDRLNGGDGNDTLYGGADNDVLKGALGDDTMYGGTGDDTYFVDSLSDQVIENFGEGTDWVRVYVDGYEMPANVENAFVSVAPGYFLGNELDNLIIGGSGNDILNGHFGNDTIKGGAGADTLAGGYGDDTHNGGPGDDWLWGSVGADTFSGGAGDDYYHYYDGESLPGSADQILDFTSVFGAGGDFLGLSAMDANVNVALDQAFNWAGTTPTANSIWYTVVNNGDGSADFTLYGDVTGDTIAEFELNLHVNGGVLYLDDISF